MNKEKNIMWLLKNTNARVSVDNYRWIYYDEATNEWVVMNQGYRKHRASVIIRTESEELAIQSLN